MKRNPEGVVRAAGILLMTRCKPQQFLLMRHSNRWDLPKGHCEPGESYVETALRARDQLDLVAVRERQVALALGGGPAQNQDRVRAAIGPSWATPDGEHGYCYGSELAHWRRRRRNATNPTADKNAHKSELSPATEQPPSSR